MAEGIGAPDDGVNFYTMGGWGFSLFRFLQAGNWVVIRILGHSSLLASIRTDCPLVGDGARRIARRSPVRQEAPIVGRGGARFVICRYSTREQLKAY
jgi:hypothetical protein